MADYTYDSELVADPFTFQRAANSAITIYDVADESNVTPLALKDLNGLTLPNPLTSNDDAFVPAFVATSAQIKMVGGGLQVVKSSFQGVRDAAVAAASSAEASAADAAEAALLAQAPTDAQVDAGVARADIPGQVSAVVPGLVGAAVPPLVADAIANDPAVISAAADMAQSTVGLVPVFKASTPYVAGQKVIAPNGDVVSAKVNFTSTATYNAANWNASTDGAILSSLETNADRIRGLLPDGTDLNNLKDVNHVGIWYVGLSASLATMTNVPAGITVPFHVRVERGPQGYGYAKQTITQLGSAPLELWRAMTTGSAWNPWKPRGARLMPDGTDLNTLTGYANSGVWYIQSGTSAATMLNMPPNVAMAASLVYVNSGHANGFGYTEQVVTVMQSNPSKSSRTLQAPSVWNPWYLEVSPLVPRDYAMRNADLIMEQAQRCGVVIGLSDRAGIAFRMDHGTVAQSIYNIPLLRKYRLHSTTAVYSKQREVNPTDNGTPWPTVESWHRFGMSFGVHSDDHLDKPDVVGWHGGTIGALSQLKLNMPSVPFPNYIPHGSTGYDRYGGFNQSNSHEAIVGTDAGKMALSCCALIAGYRYGALRPLAGKPAQGLTHWSMEEATVAQFKAMVDNAILDKAGIAVMFHPEFVGLPGKMTWAQVEECYAYTRQQIDEGKLVSLTLDGLAFADSKSTHRDDLVRHPMMDNASQYFSQGFTETLGAFTSSTEGSWTRSLLDLSRKVGVTGGTRTAAWKVSSTTGATVSLSVSDMNDTWLTESESPITIAAGETKVIDLPFGIPLGDTTSIRNQLNLISGQITVFESHAWAA